MLSQLGIIGWDNIEHIVLSALITDQPILFVGSHGCCKTEAAFMLSRGLLGEDVPFAKYETPLINTDDLLGYINTKSLEKGIVEYFGTGSSIWDVQACSFDEINRANPFTVAKIMELIRTKRVMGRETKLKYVFSSANPPREYDAIYLNKATASRFVTIRVPDITTLKQSECISILENSQTIDFDSFRRGYNNILKIQFNDTDKAKLRDIVIKIVTALHRSNLTNIQPREMKSIYSLLLVTEAIAKADIGINITEQYKADIVISKIPQAFGITREEVIASDIHAQIVQILVGFSLDDPITIAQNAIDMFNVSDKNNTLWLANTKDLIERENDIDIIKQIGRILLEGLDTNIITDTIFNILMHSSVIRYFSLCDGSYNDILTWDRESLQHVIKNLFGE